MLGLNMAYMAVQFAAILLLAVGVYRFSRCGLVRGRHRLRRWPAFLGSESFLVYSAGQLSTTVAAPIYLERACRMFSIGFARYGEWRSFLKVECC